MVTPFDRGTELESAVAAIERQILATSPSLRENTFVVESKKIISVDGVHHEIDIYVTIDVAPGYTSTFVFECKNWKAAVGKNEIVIFSEKIDAARAQHGYFVAKSFTADARNQAARDRRMTLLVASEYDAAGMPVPFDFHVLNQELNHIDVRFRKVGSLSETVELIDVLTAQANFRGKAISLKGFVENWAQETCNESLRKFRSEKLAEGSYDRTAESTRDFARGDLVVDGHVMEKASLRAYFRVQLFRPAVVSYYEVSARGRVVSFAPVAMAGSTLRIQFVTPPEH